MQKLQGLVANTQAMVEQAEVDEWLVVQQLHQITYPLLVSTIEGTDMAALSNAEAQLTADLLSQAQYHYQQLAKMSVESHQRLQDEIQQARRGKQSLQYLDHT